MSYVVIQCGSAARGDSNEYSDEDYVCIYKSCDEPLGSIKSKYPEISFLSLETIKRMKEKGSLFLVHLDVDGRVCEGDPSMTTGLVGYRPQARHIENAISETQKFISSIDWYPSVHEGLLWLCDVLYVALRNVIYCTNALNSVYKFGLVEAMNGFGLNSTDAFTMENVRMGKYLFRARNYDSSVNYEIDIEAVTNLLSAITGNVINLRCGGETNWHREWEQGYWGERLLERAIINSEIDDEGYREMLKEHNYNRRTLGAEVHKRVASARKKGAARMTQ